MCEEIQTNEKTGAEVSVSYEFEVDSKGYVKPNYKASIKRFISQEMIEGGMSPQKAAEADSTFLIALAQQKLNDTPVLPERMKPVGK
jgi:hypothetical protein